LPYLIFSSFTFGRKFTKFGIHHLKTKAMKKFRKAETSLVMQLKDNALDLETLNKIHHEIWIQLQKECNDSWERYDKARAIHFNNLFELIR
jgi:hypothetical protein